MIAVVVAREGQLPTGALEAIAEAGGRALVCGERAIEALEEAARPGGEPRQPGGATGQPGGATGHSDRPEAGDSPGAPVARPDLSALELGTFKPAAFARRLALELAGEPVVLLPASPDGRDLAPRLAAELERPLYAGALEVRADLVRLVRQDGRVIEERAVAGAFVATLLPGSRAVRPGPTAAGGPVGPNGSKDDPRALEDPGDGPDASGRPRAGSGVQEPALAGDRRVDPELLALVGASPSAIDLAEAGFIVAGGGGLRGGSSFDQLAIAAEALGASLGATRVVTDAGVLSHDRQIGTTGVSVSPRFYVAIGISGAVQHVAGIGDPERIVAVNLDSSCPMMSLADLAIVTDAAEFVEELARRLGEQAPEMGAGDG